jgi:hypothetical protein
MNSPLQTALFASRPLPASHGEEMKLETIRSKCISRIVAHVGQGGLKAFLRERQPALDDMTGGELLQSYPEELLRRLDELDRAEDELAADPIIDRAPQTRAKHKTNRVLSILDELDRNSNRRCEP